jgi:RTX calcium-binding nonapeptide repeat (4 copies)/Kelch motif
MRVHPLLPALAFVAAVLGFAPQAGAAGPGYFSPTGSMSTARDAPAMAPLPDERVLVAGGTLRSPTADDVLSSAEIFDPATGTFSSAGIGSMSVPRTGAVAARLPDGRVLIAGGTTAFPSFASLASAEIFDPATNTFSSAGIGSMSVPRTGAVAAPLPDGRVLIAGGFHEGGPFGGTYLSSAEVFDPATNTFSSAGIGSMTRTRRGAVAAPLPDGRVLVAGGNFDEFTRMYACPISSAEVFDPATNTFSSTGIESMLFGRVGAAAAPLADGRVLVVGGIFTDLHCGVIGDYEATAKIAEAFDPATNSFSSVGSASVRRQGAAAAPLPDGRVLVAGGNGSSAEIFTLCSDPSAHCPVNSATCKGRQATTAGTEGPDQLSGTSGADVITGLGGNDKLRGLAGNDVICGGAGKDTLKGGRGDDRLYGEAGKDKLKGGPGKDKLKGGAGKDKQIQ